MAQWTRTGLAYVLNLDIETFNALANHMNVLKKLNRVDLFWTMYYASQVGTHKDAKKVAKAMMPDGLKLDPKENDVAKVLRAFPGGF